MLPLTYRPIKREYSGEGPTPEQVRRALQLARDPNRVPARHIPSVDFQAAAQPLLDHLADCQRITAEDLAMRIDYKD